MVKSFSLRHKLSLGSSGSHFHSALSERFYLHGKVRKQNTWFKNKEINLPLFTDDTIFNIRNSAESTDKLGKLVRIH